MKILNAARLNLILSPLVVLFSALSSLLVIRFLSPTLYADYATLMSFLSLFMLLAESGCNVGIARYLSEASKQNARYTLYIKLQLRRWFVVAVMAIILFIAAPNWAFGNNLTSFGWTNSTFILIAILAAFMLHTQLASSSMLNSFRHGKVLLISQAVMLLRAFTLVLLAIFIQQPKVLFLILIPIAFIEAIVMNNSATSEFSSENSKINTSFLNKAQIHGLVAVFDKITTALTNGPFLILILAGLYSRVELAYLAAATELLQKFLSVVALPISNLILPILNNSYKESHKYKLNLEIVGALSTLIFSFFVGGIAISLLKGIPLVLGDEYLGVVLLAAIWLVPLFFEALVRMVWGAALLTVGEYKWLNIYNFFYALFSVLIIFYGLDFFTMTSLMISLGILRVFMALILLYKANSRGYLNLSSFPVHIALVCSVGACVSVSGQMLFVGFPDYFVFSIGLFLYCIFVLAMFRFVPLIPKGAYEAIVQLLGKHSKYFLFAVPLFIKN